MANGVYILANDVVYDQLIALINSLETNVSPDLPICVVPYDDNTEKCRLATQRYSQVQWFDDEALLNKWENFASEIWSAHPAAIADWKARGIVGVGRMGMHRRFCCFDGPFDRFIYLDADILAMNNFDLLFDSLDDYDFVTYDFQYKDLSHVFAVDAPNLTDVFERDRLNTEIFCAGLFASKKGLFTDQMLSNLLTSLKAGEAEILYYNGPDQSILNYMVMKSEIKAMNLARTLPADIRTGCCVTSSHFKEQDYVLFDQEQQLIYLHYIGVGSRFFCRLCAGENILLPYRDLFLHYRYLNGGDCPPLKGIPIPYDAPTATLRTRIPKKVEQLVSRMTRSFREA